MLEMCREANFVLALEGISFRDWIMCTGVVGRKTIWLILSVKTFDNL